MHKWLNGQGPPLQATKELWSSVNTCVSNTTAHISNCLLMTKADSKSPSVTLCAAQLFICYVRARPVGCWFILVNKAYGQKQWNTYYKRFKHLSVHWTPTHTCIYAHLKFMQENWTVRPTSLYIHPNDGSWPWIHLWYFLTNKLKRAESWHFSCLWKCSCRPGCCQHILCHCWFS